MVYNIELILLVYKLLNGILSYLCLTFDGNFNYNYLIAKFTINVIPTMDGILSVYFLVRYQVNCPKAITFFDDVTYSEQFKGWQTRVNVKGQLAINADIFILNCKLIGRWNHY